MRNPKKLSVMLIAVVLTVVLAVTLCALGNRQSIFRQQFG